jgi:radical SAM superfamily enzyme YgiQ (UPF0313 family)
MILPALTEAVSPFFRALKYSLFPPLGLASLAGYLGDDDEVEIVNEHVEAVRADDDPDLVVMTVYISAARRAYKLADTYRARGAHVCMGGLHVTACPDEAAAHADTIFLGPGEDTWPAFLADFRAARAAAVYRSRQRTLIGAPPARRDLFKRHQYLVPNTIVVSRGCPHKCDFCYNSGFYAGGRSFYTKAVDAALAEIDSLPGRHLYFLDDHLFGDERFAAALFDGMRGMGRLWQAAGTVRSVLRPGLLEGAARSGLRSLFVGFEAIDPAALAGLNKRHNEEGTYEAAIRRLHDSGVMVNGSFVFGLDGDDEGVFERTVDWAVARGIETSTFHILTPYPGTRLWERLAADGRITSRNWDLYDARHVVFRPARMSAAALEAGHRRAYRDFYRWDNVVKSARAEPALADRIRHMMYVGGWRKLEPMWNVLIKLGLLGRMMPLLESLLAGFGRYGGEQAPKPALLPAVPAWDAAGWARHNARGAAGRRGARERMNRLGGCQARKPRVV